MQALSINRANIAASSQDHTMASLDQHPTVVAVRSRPARPAPGRVSAAWLREVCLAAGADDVGFVAIDRDEIAADRPDILQTFPETKTLVSLVCRMNREPVRNPARSVANLEFHRTGDHVNDTARDIVRVLEDEGIRAMNAPVGFPMEATKFPGKIWVVSHKPVAVAAGLGQMGIHRNVIHPRFGSFILLGTVLLAADVDEESKPVGYDPCVSCKLCVAACPVGAIKPDGRFDAGSCLTHNYREFMNGPSTIGGFLDGMKIVFSGADRLPPRPRRRNGRGDGRRTLDVRLGAAPGPTPPPGSASSARSPVAGRSRGSGLTVPRRRTFASGILARRSLHVRCASPSWLRLLP
jgi:ferredoxin